MLKPLSIASYNWKVLLKSLFCQMLVLALMLAFVIIVFGGFASDVLRVITETKVTDFISSTMSQIFDGTFNSTTFTNELNTLITNLQDSIKSIKYPWGGATLSYIVVFLTMIVYRLFVSYTDVTVACQIDEFMTSNAERPFLWFLLKKQGRTWQFSCLQLLCCLPLDILIITGALGIYMLFLIAFGWWTIIPVVVFMVLLYAVRQTFFAFCLPAVASEDMPCVKAFKQGVSQIVMRFWRVFWKNLVVICLMVAISLVAIMLIDNSWAQTAMITVPNFVLFFYIKCINMTEYFEANKRPYFHKRVAVEGTELYNKRQQRLEAKKRCAESKKKKDNTDGK